jgi:hypothetical protein
MDDDIARKISSIEKPSDNEAESEKYENDVMKIKSQGVSRLI